MSEGAAAPLVARIAIGAGHPACDGHFPGQPIVPGVVLLDHVLHTIERLLGLVPPVRFGRVKFLRPVAPGTVLGLRLDRRPGDTIGFVLSEPGDEAGREPGLPVASGTASFAVLPPEPLPPGPLLSEMMP